jgi:signal transduction histidine kinase
MEIPIMSLDINNELDIMLAHRRGMQFAKFSGVSLSEQTRFATAVSEISRNCIEYAFNGHVHFSVVKETDKCFLLAVIKDEGKGIANVKEILERDTKHYRGRGLGIVYAKKLADDFRIVTNAKGTTVYVQKNIPANTSHINKLVVQGWVKHLREEPAISAYEELKMRNVHLVELTEELKTNANMVEKQMEEIKKLNIRLSTNNERMRAFTYAISHDLRTPLTNLKISSSYLVDNADGGEDTPIFRGILTRSVNRLDKTIHSLIEILDVQNQEKHVIRQLDFTTLLSEVLEEFDPVVKASAASISSDFTKAQTIQYVEGFLQSLLRNLLSNSLKYKEPGRKLNIKITTKKIGDGVQLIFSDTASGMDLATIKDRLFAPFTRFSSVAEGKGIGLYLIKSMVESNGGSVVVESTPGKGTTFSFSLIPYIK